MSTSQKLILPLLLSLPLALVAQDTATQLSPALRAKLLAQNNTPVPNPGAVPAGAPATATPAAPAEAAPAAPAATTPAGAPAAAPGTTPATPGATPRPTVPRPSIPLPSGTPRPGSTATPRPTTAPGAAALPGAPPTTAAAAGDTTTAADPANPWGDIALVNADITDVITKYEEITQRHIIRDKDLQGTVTIVANPNPAVPFSRDEAAEFIKAALAIQGFVIQPYSKNIDKILMLTRPPGQEPPLEGAPLYTREQDLPETDDIVNFVLTLKHLPVADASQVFANAVPTHQWTKYVAVPSANSIFVQETVSNIRTLIKVTKSLDLPPVKMVHEWVELERASAEDVQAILDQILQAQTQSRSSGGNSGFRSISPAAAAGQLAQPGAAPQPVVAGSTGGSASSGMMPDGSSVIVKADPRTNRVFINGPEEHVDYLKKLIHEFDMPSRVKNLLTQQIRYIPVNEFFDLALTALEATGAGQLGSGGSAGGGASGATGGARTTGGRSTGGGDFGSAAGGGGDFRSNFNSRSSGSTGSFGGSSTGGRSTGSRAGGSSGLAGGANTDPPRAQTVGKTLLVSDPRTNSLIVSGPPDSIQRVSDLVKQMDRRPYQVHINAVIAQMAIGDDMKTSVDFLRQVETLDIGGRTVNAAGFFRSAADGTWIDPTTLNSIDAFNDITDAASGFNFYAAAGDLFNAYVNALETTNRSRLLAKPHITVANNQVGTISSGERVPIPSNQQSTVVSGGTTSLNSSIEYENVVLSLDVQPLINSKNEITLNVSQLNDTVNGTTRINDNDIPNISTQELSTSITIPNGAILVLGGLLSDQERKSNSGLPILSKIPVIKYLVGSNTRNKQRRELLILLQARIIETADDMVDINTSEIQRTVVGPDAEAFAKPNRNTDNVTLPTFESDRPFDGNNIDPAPQPAPKSTTRKR